MSLHPSLEPLRALVGTWRGHGRGEYPTIDPFEYTEEVTFTDVGKPFLTYSQRTWSLTGQPMHVETGYLRAPDNGAVEFVLAQPTGQTELAEGPLSQEPSGFTAELRSQVVNSSTAKIVDQTIRRIRLDADTLTTSFDMAAVGVPMSHHLSAVLTRAGVTTAPLAEGSTLVAKRMQSAPGSSFPRHRASAESVLVVTEGRCTIHEASSHRTVNAGDSAVIAADEWHRVDADPSFTAVHVMPKDIRFTISAGDGEEEREAR